MDGNHAYKMIREIMRYVDPTLNTNHGGTYPNFFDAHPPFQIDGNFGVCAGIAEMLKNEALPKEWSGSVKGIKLHAGKEISYSFKNGKRV